MFIFSHGLRWTKMVFTSYLHFQHCHSRSPYLKDAEAGRGLTGGSDGNILENHSYLIQHISVEIYRNKNIIYIYLDLAVATPPALLTCFSLDNSWPRLILLRA